jgi:hypothetical protein
MSSDPSISDVAPDSPQAHWRLDGTEGTRLEVNVCPLHPGGVELLLTDGVSTAVVELEVGDVDEVQAFISALARAHQVAVARRG